MVPLFSKQRAIVQGIKCGTLRLNRPFITTDTRVTFAWRSDGGFNSDWSRHERVTQASRACHASVTRVSRKRHVSTMWSVSNCYLAWRARDTRVTCAWRARKVVDKTDGIYLSAYNTTHPGPLKRITLLRFSVYFGGYTSNILNMKWSISGFNFLRPVAPP